MLPELREGTGTAEGVALVVPGLASALEEQRDLKAGEPGALLSRPPLLRSAL